MTKPAVLTGTHKEEGASLIVTGAFDIKMTDFNVEQPSLLGMKADGVIKLRFTAYFTK